MSEVICAKEDGVALVSFGNHYGAVCSKKIGRPHQVAMEFGFSMGHWNQTGEVEGAACGNPISERLKLRCR